MIDIAMNDLIEKHRHDLEQLCRKHDVKMLALFGSAAEGKFEPERSDLDVLVNFLPPAAGLTCRLPGNNPWQLQPSCRKH